MEQIRFDFSEKCGQIRPMHAVNNGPVYKFHADQRITNMDAFKEAGIPYVRNHDASFNATYGGEHTVDVHAIFPDFDADVNDPASYDFVMTDEYLRVIEFSGAKTFYRLGSKIEHGVKKYGTLPPKDFQKWAEICEHIIRHYTEGWADGFKMDIEYWEIWNEPDGEPDDSTNKKQWGGTKKQFFELYDIAATHLKKCFPHLKIGGPAMAQTAFDDYTWAEDFLAQLKAPLDFLSWHTYHYDPRHIAEICRIMRNLLNKYGFEKTESIMNEWNYVRGWYAEDWLYSLKTEKNYKGAAYIAGTIIACQNEDVDMLMYYDARPCGMNGMFSTDFVCDCLKGYYPFRMFNNLYKLGGQVQAEADNNRLYALGATDGKDSAAMVTYYDDVDDTEDVKVEITFDNLDSKNGVRVVCSRLDEDLDDEVVTEFVCYSDKFSVDLNFKNYTTYLIKATAL